MTDVSTNSTPAYDYTWANATFTWASDSAQVKTWATATANSVSLDVTEYVTLVETVAREMSISKQEALSVVDDMSQLISFVRLFSESIGIAETYTDIINFLMNAVESFSVGEVAGNSVDLKPFEESFGIADSALRSVGLNCGEFLSVGEDFSRAVAFYKTILESMNFSELDEKDYFISPFQSSFSVVDDEVNGIGKNVAELIAVVDILGRAVAYKMSLAESLSVSESLSNATDISFSESVALFEEYRRNGNNVISDIHVSSGEITQVEFDQMLTRLSAVGYERFNKIMTGDYEYQKAIVKIALSSTNADRPQLDSCSLDVDVPDVHDRGQAAVAVDGSVISFNRPYYTPPEVNVTLKSGSTAIRAMITAITENDFTLILYNAADASVTGTVSWASNGF